MTLTYKLKILGKLLDKGHKTLEPLDILEAIDYHQKLIEELQQRKQKQQPHIDKYGGKATVEIDELLKC